MLKILKVQNYALIDELNLQFGKNLNIITGETGAGKSVLMGALGLLLGDRTDTNALLDKTKKCIIEGAFSDTPDVKIFLLANELDSDDDLILRREINKDGKSRTFINDTPVNLSLLKEIGDLLVDIHSQHETLLLNKSDFQLSVVDAFSSHDELLFEFKNAFKKYRLMKDELNSLKENEKRARTDQDYIRFQFNELDEANMTEGEQIKLEEELNSLTHSEEIKSGIDRISNIISGEEDNLLTGISNAINTLNDLSKYQSSFEELSKRLKATQIELKDIDYEIQQSAADVTINPKKVESITARLDQIYKLQHKHRVDTIEELIALRDSFSDKLISFTSLEEKIIVVEAEMSKLFSIVKKLSDKISDNRKKAIPGIESKIKKLLSEVSMPHATLKIEITELDDDNINTTGRDKVKFLFSANKGIPFSDISKVASGGELSRLMLCIKSSVARLIEMPTIVFDEIDTGVSGETAFRIGKVMHNLSGNHQLIAITHLPQIASRGEDHFFVYKEVSGKKTFTKVKKLSKDERVVEVARMLSGDKPTAVAMENAKELLKN